LATLPFTLTRPASIQVSISRREPNPAAASSFCNRSAVGAGGGLLLLGLFFADCGFCFCLGFGRGNHLELEGLGDLFERRQLLQRAQAEVVEELGGRGVERGPTGVSRWPTTSIQPRVSSAWMIWVDTTYAAHVLDVARG
jgi:hypothetical protein